MIYKNIKKICDSKKISIRELECRAELGNGTISGWKTSSPTVEKLKRVADVLECTIDKLIEL